MGWNEVMNAAGFGVFVIAATFIGMLTLSLMLILREKHLKPSWDALGAVVKELVK